MELDKILQNLESRLVRVGHALWNPDLKEHLREAEESLADEVRERHKALDQAQADRSALQRRITANQNAIDVLTGHIQACLTYGHGDQAWQFALQLDALRQELSRNQAHLPKIEQICWSVQFQVRQLERRLVRLQQQMDS
jgi:predicted  nucleic acid-binding Zn-ribbon protein